VAQNSVNCLVKSTLKCVRNAFNTCWLYKSRSKWDPSMFNAQLTMLWYRSTNWLAGLYANIPVNTGEYFRLNDFWAALQKQNGINKCWYCESFIFRHRQLQLIRRILFMYTYMSVCVCTGARQHMYTLSKYIIRYIYMQKFSTCKIYHWHYAILGYHNNELSSVNTLHDRK
jgi:hypothetical protein